MKLTLMADEGELVRVRCEGEIRDVRYQIQGDPMERALGPGCFTRRVLLDLERAELIDSSGISWLIVTHKHFKQGGGRLVLHSIPPRIGQVLHFLHMHRVFHLAEDEPAARSLAVRDQP
jgi:anti-anti-sigma factor